MREADLSDDLLTLARRIDDGQPIDWDDEERRAAGDASTRAMVLASATMRSNAGALRILASRSLTHGPSNPPSRFCEGSRNATRRTTA